MSSITFLALPKGAHLFESLGACVEEVLPDTPIRYLIGCRMGDLQPLGKGWLMKHYGQVWQKARASLFLCKFMGHTFASIPDARARRDKLRALVAQGLAL